MSLRSSSEEPERHGEYLEHPQLVQVRQVVSLLDHKRYVEQRGCAGIGYGRRDGLSRPNQLERRPRYFVMLR